MNVRVFFNRQCFFAAILCPALLFFAASMSFPTRKIPKSPEYQLTPQFFKWVSCGFWPAAADFLWVQTLQTAGTSNYSNDTLPEVFDFYRLMTSLDPNFYEAYDQAAVILGFYYESAESAISILDRGVLVYRTGHPPEKFWTHPYSLYMYRAYVNAFLKNDWLAAKRDYLEAGSIKGAPVYLDTMKEWLQKEGSEKTLAVKVLSLLMKNATDPIIRARYQEKLKHYE